MKRIALTISALLVAASIAWGMGGGGGNTIKIGVAGPMALGMGKHHMAGAQMAADEINNAGGVKVGETTYMVELVQVDTNEISSVPDAASAVERAITVDGVTMVTGMIRSEAALAVQEVAMDYRTIMIVAGASHISMSQKVEENYDRYKYWFRVAPFNNVNLGKLLFSGLGSLVANVIKGTGQTNLKVALLAEKALWTEGIVAIAGGVLQQTAAGISKAIGTTVTLELVGTWQPSDKATDVTAELTAIKRSEADIVLTAISGPMGLVFSRQMGELEVPAIAYGFNVPAQEDTFWEATDGQAAYQANVSFIGEAGLSPTTFGFMEAFRERMGESPTYNAATYDAVMVYVDAIRQAGSLDPDMVVPVMEKTDRQTAGGRLVFDANHDPTWGPGYMTGVGLQWVNGELKVWWPDGWNGVRYEGTYDLVLPPALLQRYGR